MVDLEGGVTSTLGHTVQLFFNAEIIGYWRFGYLFRVKHVAAKFMRYILIYHSL